MKHLARYAYQKSIVLIVFCVLMACDNNIAVKPQSELLKFEEFQVYGEVHNQFLTNVNDNFKVEDEISTLDEALDYIDDFQQDYLLKADLQGLDKQSLSNALTSSKELVIYDLAYKKMFNSSGKRVSEEELNLFQLLENANNNGLLDDFEYQSLTKLGEKVKGSYEGSISEEELKEFTIKLKNDWISRGYTVDSENGKIMAIALAISLSSLEWWEDNQEAGIAVGSNGRTLALPAWAAADIGGAIVSAAVSATAQYAANGEVNAEATAYSALGGAVTTSTGAAGQIGKLISKLF